MLVSSFSCQHIFDKHYNLCDIQHLILRS